MAKKSGKSSATHRARSIVDSGVDVRAKMHELVHSALTTGEFDLAAVREATQDALTGVGDALRNSAPRSEKSVLNQVFAGLTDAVASGADAAREAIEHAKAKGKRVSSSQLKSFVKTMSTLEDEFLSTVSKTTANLSASARDELDDLARRGKKAGTRIGPAANRALAAATSNAGGLVSDAAKTGVRAALAVTGEVALGVSGLLSGLGEAIKGAQSARRSPVARKAPKRAAVKKKARKR